MSLLPVANANATTPLYPPTLTTPGSPPTVTIPATVRAETYWADISGTQVVQPKIQFGTTTGSGGSGGPVTVTIPQSYTSAASYVVTVTMEDTNAAEMSANRTSSNTFDIYWQNGGGGSHTLAWVTYGL